MIPLRDTIPSATYPVVTQVLIALNVAVFLYEQSLGAAAERLIYAYGLVPRRFNGDVAAEIVPLFSSMFLHGGWMHLIGNMLYLHIFGDNVEDRVGHARFLMLYVIAGAVAGLAQVATNPGSVMPMVGASGAISGVTGAYLVFYPRSRIVTLVPVFIFLQVIEIPALVLLLFWFLYQLVLGISFYGADVGGVAFWAHIGGFVTGAVLGPILGAGRPRRPQPVW
jgi:membrane associated rhomboid family serine protease